MKKLIILLSILSFNTLFASYDVSLICKSSFNGNIYNLVEEYNATCLADSIWGYKSVCYDGSAETLVQLMNDEFFNKRGMIVNYAVLNENGSISYVGVDQGNFWSSERTLFACNN
jgi:hypothetical protein